MFLAWAQESSSRSPTDTEKACILERHAILKCCSLRILFGIQFWIKLCIYAMWKRANVWSGTYGVWMDCYGQRHIPDRWSMNIKTSGQLATQHKLELSKKFQDLPHYMHDDRNCTNPSMLLYSNHMHELTHEPSYSWPPLDCGDAVRRWPPGKTNSLKAWFHHHIPGSVHNVIANSRDSMDDRHWSCEDWLDIHPQALLVHVCLSVWLLTRSETDWHDLKSICQGRVCRQLF